jgi:NAD(P)-dependent dehydrogenase (short-subunit alcohol dehydrogenase family)
MPLWLWPAAFRKSFSSGLYLIAGGEQMKLAGKVALVTGASSGIGRASALALAEAGADVVVNGQSHMQQAEEVAHQIEAMGRKAMAVQADVSKPTDVDRLVAQTVDTMGKVDILFNNAGMFQIASLEEHSNETWQRIIDVNLTGHFLCCRRVVPEMKKLGKGKIINNGSIFGHQGVPNAVAYGVSKMGVHGLTRCLAVELAPHKINVNAIAPGNVVTPINDPLYQFMAGDSGDIEAGKKALGQLYPWGRLGEVTDITPALIYFASDDSDFVTGQILFVDGGYSVP